MLPGAFDLSSYALSALCFEYLDVRTYCMGKVSVGNQVQDLSVAIRFHARANCGGMIHHSVSTLVSFQIQVRRVAATSRFPANRVWRELVKLFKFKNYSQVQLAV